MTQLTDKLRGELEGPWRAWRSRFFSEDPVAREICAELETMECNGHDGTRVYNRLKRLYRQREEQFQLSTSDVSPVRLMLHAVAMTATHRGANDMADTALESWRARFYAADPEAAKLALEIERMERSGQTKTKSYKRAWHGFIDAVLAYEESSNDPCPPKAMLMEVWRQQAKAEASASN